VSHDGLKSNGWKRSNETTPAANTGGTKAEKMGKRKTLAEQGNVERRDIKRYRIVDEEEEENSADEAEAAEQPRHTQ
jgi:hypothetical protein